MTTAKLQIVTALLATLVVCGYGCNKGETGERIAMAEGTLSLKNESSMDVFPVVHAEREEDFGGVSIDAFKVIGFASIEVDKVARVVWAEDKWDGPKKTVYFHLKTTPKIAERTKYLEFCYKGNNRWFLNLFDGNPRVAGKLLVSIPGQEEAK